MSDSISFQPKGQTPVHIVASRQTATATSILRVLLTASGKEIRLKKDSVSKTWQQQNKINEIIADKWLCP